MPHQMRLRRMPAPVEASMAYGMLPRISARPVRSMIGREGSVAVRRSMWLYL